MSGIAITIPGSNFNSAFGNVVTDLVDVSVTGISIACNDYYVGTRYALGINYTPVKTSNRGCRWSIVSGSEYAAIDATTGVLTIFETANMSVVKVKAVSNYDNKITAEKEITVMYRRAALPNSHNLLGELSNVDSIVDEKFQTNKVLIKEAESDEWKAADFPKLETRYTEDEVN